MTGSPSAPLPEAVTSARRWIIDLDGVLWLAGRAIGDVAGAVADLRRRGVALVFATNNSSPTTGELVERLAGIGVTASPSEVVSSAHAVASLLAPGSTVHVLAEAGMAEALAARGVRTSGDGPVDAAVVGFSHGFDFVSLTAVAAAARSSGRLLASNEDPVHPTPDGLLPGTGALVAAVATASGVTPVIAGKPHDPMVRLLRDRFGVVAGEGGVVLVGDQPRTDGRLAERLGIPFVLVDSGVTAAGTAVTDVPVAVRAPDFASVVARLP